MSRVRIRKPFVCQPISIQERGRPDTLDPTRTALAAAAYVRRTRFEKAGMEPVDFAKRGEDLLAVMPITPPDAPEWVHSPFLRWKLADEASDRTRNPEDIRAWHVVGDLPSAGSRGEWLDGCFTLVRQHLPSDSVADLALHTPRDGTPAHMHLIVASRLLARARYGAVAYDVFRCLDRDLRAGWAAWCRQLDRIAA